MTSAAPAKSPFNKESETEPKEPFIKRFWLAGPAPFYPQPVVMVPGRVRGIRFVGGCATVTSEADAEWVKKTLGSAVFEEDWPEDKPAPALQPLGYAPRSYGAQDAHQRLIRDNTVGS